MKLEIIKEVSLTILSTALALKLLVMALPMMVNGSKVFPLVKGHFVGLLVKLTKVKYLTGS